MKEIGIVGVGGHAASVLQSILTLEAEGEAHLHGAVVRNPARYSEVVAKLEAERRVIYSSWEEMLERGQSKIDMIAIPTGIPYHRDMAVQALEAGYDVVLEKPVAATVQEADDIISAEKRTGHFCAIAYQHIHSAAIQAIVEDIRRLTLGTIRHIKSYVLWPRNRSYYDRNNWAGQLKVDGHWVLDGPLTNACAHFLHAMLYLLNAERLGDYKGGRQVRIESLRAELYRANDIAGYDTACLRARTATGAELFMVASHAVNEVHNPVIEIEGEDGFAKWTLEGALATIESRYGTMRRVRTPGEYDFGADVFRNAIAVAEGRRSEPLVTVSNGRLQVLAVNLAFESSGGIMDIPANYRQVVMQDNGDYRTIVKDLESIACRAYDEFKLFSELGVPWAKPTPEVSGEDYTAFPRSAELREYLETRTS